MITAAFFTVGLLVLLGALAPARKRYRSSSFDRRREHGEVMGALGSASRVQQVEQ